MATIVVYGIPENVSERTIIDMIRNLRHAASSVNAVCFEPDDVEVSIPVDRARKVYTGRIFATVNNIGADKHGNYLYEIVQGVAQAVGVAIKKHFPKTKVLVNAYFRDHNESSWSSDK